MLNKKTLKDFDFNGKKALVRVDFNVPMSKEKEGEIADDVRIRAALPTIEYLMDNGAVVVLMSHLGRPKGEANPKFTLEPVAKRLSELLKKDVAFIASDVVVDDEVVAKVNELKPGDVCLLQNTRYRNEEEKMMQNFLSSLLSLEISM